MCKDNTIFTYIKNNFSQPNLILIRDRARYDVTATMINIENGYGSKTKCDEKEATKRRLQKEKIKLFALAFMLGANLDMQDEQTASYWVCPEIRGPLDEKTFPEYFAIGSLDNLLEETEEPTES